MHWLMLMKLISIPQVLKKTVKESNEMFEKRVTEEFKKAKVIKKLNRTRWEESNPNFSVAVVCKSSAIISLLFGSPRNSVTKGVAAMMKSCRSYLTKIGNNFLPVVSKRLQQLLEVMMTDADDLRKPLDYETFLTGTVYFSLFVKGCKDTRLQK
ncbi:PREDICTED: uncharacterized protein LOC109154307 [Ipomoea nil]|uniref:uncharacterized protein LOC109154307 n=1 Tax=Ipomoea nil TaxID=35883 RepID=UPI00090132D8|nr:PREDICTED: uncharacterized protein LOC109154307 [Ipomoea nil]